MALVGKIELREQLGMAPFLDHFGFLGNCPPTPPLNHYFALSER